MTNKLLRNAVVHRMSAVFLACFLLQSIHPSMTKSEHLHLIASSSNSKRPVKGSSSSSSSMMMMMRELSVFIIPLIVGRCVLWWWWWWCFVDWSIFMSSIHTSILCSLPSIHTSIHTYIYPYIHLYIHLYRLHRGAVLLQVFVQHPPTCGHRVIERINHPPTHSDSQIVR